MESSKGFFRGSLVHHGILGVVSSHTLTILGGESMAVWFSVGKAVRTEKCHGKKNAALG